MPKKPTRRGPSAQFTGSVHADELFTGVAPSRMSAALVRFAPGARTAWHMHALGQVLAVTDGIGVVQSRGGEPVIVRAGDVIDTPPGEWHWHGATEADFMSHLAMREGCPPGSEVPDVEWGAHVSEEEYTAAIAHVAPSGTPATR